MNVHWSTSQIGTSPASHFTSVPINQRTSACRKIDDRSTKNHIQSVLCWTKICHSHKETRPKKTVKNEPRRHPSSYSAINSSDRDTLSRQRRPSNADDAPRLRAVHTTDSCVHCPAIPLTPTPTPLSVSSLWWPHIRAGPSVFHLWASLINCSRAGRTYWLHSSRTPAFILALRMPLFC